MKNELSINDSNVLKGVALIMLLTHHLFFKSNGLYNDVMISSHHGLFNIIGLNCKMCVSLFLFISGLGITIQTEKKGGIENMLLFYRRRLLKLMLNYWFIWLIFVPIGVLVFQRPFSIYGEHIIFRLVIDILGISHILGYEAYNATWWFISCILVMYLLFPYFYRLLKAHHYALIPILISLSVFPISLIQYDYVLWILPFVTGMVFALLYKRVEKHYVSECKIETLLLLLSAILLFVGRTYWVNALFDSIFCCVITVVFIKSRLSITANKCLAFIGKHSMNIFLFHTFILSHWFRSLIYYPRNPVLCFMLLLSICLVISVILERIKDMTGLNMLISKI